MSMLGRSLVLAWPEWLAFGLLLGLLAWWLESRAGAGRPARSLRLLIVVLVAFALARPALDPGLGPAWIALVDRSASLPAGAADAALDALLASPAEAPRLVFGDAESSPLAESIDLAARALPAGGRILLISDGRWTEPLDSELGALVGGSLDSLSERMPEQPIEAASRARAAGIRVDALRLVGRGGRDGAIVEFSLPPAIRSGDILSLVLGFRATSAMTGSLTIELDEEILEERALALPAGDSGLTIQRWAPAQGPHRLRARLDLAADVEPGNDALWAGLHVSPPPSVLVLGDGPGAIGLADVLAGAGMRATVLAPERLPSRLSQLEGWDAMALVDLPAASLGSDQQLAIRAFAAELGRGVLMTGGRQSFLPGGWEGSVLADMAPVEMEAPNRAEREAVALLFMIDQSASMGGAEGRGAISKLDLAREAALLAAEVLHPGDTVGVVTYDDAARWLLPLTPVGVGRALAEFEAALAGLETGGGTRITAALELGLPALEALAELPTRHAVLLTDGRDFDSEVEVPLALVRRAREAGITLSTIAVGSDADRELLSRLARAGRGRYHSADDPSDLPRLAVEESEIVRARSEQRGRFRASPPRAAEAPILSGLDVAALPEFGGYLAMRPRAGAEIALLAPAGDPLLASWQYGLGRVLAWTSDLGEEWCLDWPGSPAAEAFWARLLGYVARAPDAGPPGLLLRADALGARIAVDARDPSGRPIDLAQVRILITGTEQVEVLDLPQDAPGRYAGRFVAESPGGWPAALDLVGPEGEPHWTLPLALSRPYARELRPPRDGAAALAGIVAAGGGRMLEAGGEPLDQGRGELARVELWPWLLALAALLWLVEVARQMDLWRGARLPYNLGRGRSVPPRDGSSA